jgi:hypothetical protein
VAEPPDDWQNEDGITCKFCGENYLTWEEVRGPHNRKHWVLVNEKGDIHDCRRSETEATDFPIVSED